MKIILYIITAIVCLYLLSVVVSFVLGLLSSDKTERDGAKVGCVLVAIGIIFSVLCQLLGCSD